MRSFSKATMRVSSSNVSIARGNMGDRLLSASSSVDMDHAALG